MTPGADLLELEPLPDIRDAIDEAEFHELPKDWQCTVCRDYYHEDDVVTVRHSLVCIGCCEEGHGWNRRRW